ncbi:hypothetical protein [Tepidimicrobium xylanilyticum]|uniref:Uncharacterized protein n=1 Tax=Tepidimicrobium xylanilyticum TaxID=1123352 RepID=A0A1H2QL39_9FIRM|nr:hypothetical protein [Tepidimicrobium xylanilyticum]GMG95632.1 hypothetical protein EN5CB1_04580 [Tepidimicrobium xylanilyticum]SDW07923.1 hypothetical protein SAMN05660923_00175 [Tepidimicrobium xylanilyticum]
MEPFVDEFVENLKKEIDHSGALLLLMEEILDRPIYCSLNGAKNLKAHFHRDWNFVEVKTEDELEIGKIKVYNSMGVKGYTTYRERFEVIL